MLKISVAMTTYNGERFIRQQLESIMRQTRKADEVVIFDDGSTDHTVEIAERFIRDNNLNNWVLKVNRENLGYVQNFYQAVEAAGGDIIFLSDQDDVWHADKIEKMAAIFAANKDIKMLSAGFCKIDAEGNTISDKPKHGYVNHGLLKGHIRPGGLGRIGFAQIFRVNISPGCTTAFTRECKELYSKNATKTWYHDWELCIFGAMLDGLYFYNEELMDYRIHSGNAIGLKDNKRSLAMSEDQQGRVVLAKTEYERVRLYATESLFAAMGEKNKKTLLKYCRFTKERLDALTKRSIGKWIACMGHLSNYIKAVGFRGIPGDLIYILRPAGGRG